MADWKYPSWRRISPSVYQDATDEQIAAWEQETEECEAANKQENERLRQRQTEMNAIAEDIWTPGKSASGFRLPSADPKELKAILRQQRPFMPAIGSSFANMKANIKAAREKKQKDEQGKHQSAKQEAMKERAVLWLQARGEVLGTDFSLVDAVAVAHDLAAEEFIAERRARGGFVSFGGDDECEDCRGWDMTSNRCECGNRRVGWETGWDHSFENPYLYAQAN